MQNRSVGKISSFVLLLCCLGACSPSIENTERVNSQYEARFDSLQQVILNLEREVDALSQENMDLSIAAENPPIQEGEENWFARQLMNKAPLVQIGFQFYTQTNRQKCNSEMFGGYENEDTDVNVNSLRWVYGCINDQYSIAQMESFYGMPVFRKINRGSDGAEIEFWSETDFSFYNPEFVKLMNEQVLAVQKSPIGRAIMREVYEKYFQDYFRKFWLADQWLNVNPDQMNQLRSRYNQIMQDEGRYLYNGLFDGGDWPMQDKFEDQKEVSYALAFWMRRQSGGTDDEFRILFQNILNTVDERFLTEQ